jgi:hypothetical protein
MTGVESLTVYCGATYLLEYCTQVFNIYMRKILKVMVRSYSVMQSNTDDKIGHYYLARITCMLQKLPVVWVVVSTY